MLVPVDNRADPALLPFTSVRERDLVGREGLFLAEGEVILRVLVLQSRVRVRSLLLERRRVDSVRDVLEALHPDVPVYVVPQALMDDVVGFSIHRGVLACGERPPVVPPAALLEAAPLTVALVGLTNHDNVGGIFRNAAAFGASVLLDEATCDPLYRKAIRVSAGAALTVPFARTASIDELFAALAVSRTEAFALSPRGEEDVAVLSTPSAPTRKCLVLGTEGPGLPDTVLTRCRRVRISMTPGFDSLNVAVASGIALHAARPR